MECGELYRSELSNEREREKEQAQTLILGIAWFTDSFHVQD